jgi:hypothetical protein
MPVTFLGNVPGNRIASDPGYLVRISRVNPSMPEARKAEY